MVVCRGGRQNGSNLKLEYGSANKVTYINEGGKGFQTLGWEVLEVLLYDFDLFGMRMRDS